MTPTSFQLSRSVKSEYSGCVLAVPDRNPAFVISVGGVAGVDVRGRRVAGGRRERHDGPEVHEGLPGGAVGAVGGRQEDGRGDQRRRAAEPSAVLAVVEDQPDIGVLVAVGLPAGDRAGGRRAHRPQREGGQQDGKSRLESSTHVNILRSVAPGPSDARRWPSPREGRRCLILAGDSPVTGLAESVHACSPKTRGTRRCELVLRPLVRPGRRHADRHRPPHGRVRRPRHPAYELDPPDWSRPPVGSRLGEVTSEHRRRTTGRCADGEAGHPRGR